MMEQTVIDCLKLQRNEAMDTIALLNGHLAAERAKVAELEAQLAKVKANEPV